MTSNTTETVYVTLVANTSFEPSAPCYYENIKRFGYTFDSERKRWSKEIDVGDLAAMVRFSNGSGFDFFIDKKPELNVQLEAKERSIIPSLVGLHALEKMPGSGKYSKTVYHIFAGEVIKAAKRDGITLKAVKRNVVTNKPVSSGLPKNQYWNPYR